MDDGAASRQRGSDIEAWPPSQASDVARPSTPPGPRPRPAKESQDEGIDGVPTLAGRKVVHVGEELRSATGCCGLSPAANGRRRFASLDLKRGSKQKHATTPLARQHHPSRPFTKRVPEPSASSSSSHAGGEGGRGKEGKKSVAVSASGTEYEGPHDDAVDGMYQESAPSIAPPPAAPHARQTRLMITKRICVASCLRRPATPRSNFSIHPSLLTLPSFPRIPHRGMDGNTWGISKKPRSFFGGHGPAVHGPRKTTLSQWSVAGARHNLHEVDGIISPP